MWGLLAVVALLWPARTVGLLDGLPLEHTIANAVLLGVVLPTLLWFHPRFLRARLARVRHPCPPRLEGVRWGNHHA